MGLAARGIFCLDETLFGDGVPCGNEFPRLYTKPFGLNLLQFFLDVSIRVMLFLVVNVPHYGSEVSLPKR